MLEAVIFAIVSLGLVKLSWPWLGDPNDHGFFRFFAFETILLLILLNLAGWFRDPFSAHQIVAWLLLLASLLLAVHGFQLLRFAGRPEGRIENTQVLVTAGAYRYIRHPLYASLLLFAWGTFFKDPSLLGLLLAAAASAFLVATARVEEVENLEKFGPAYAAYMKRTRMFLPLLF